ncbi:putative hydrolase of HD superfamily [Tamaricihabitans halophyticus]|uniref:Putative hydrolase of HD superfamily n=1 Tax=Tamaricihabitans halophyticus TaxID=1262583 RepID=A0A4R2QKG3_9PSEU|nr:HD domain-containing protein [Tamaricihabitans halophyticus]TCP49339.1 putative hydrolase of HD superfamily [Tamaricihabitans halophyticus]
MTSLHTATRAYATSRASAGLSRLMRESPFVSLTPRIPEEPAEQLLAELNPLPTEISARLGAQLTFLIEVDKLKSVLRQSPLATAARRENDAEHSWHLAMMVPLLAEYADEPIDVGHTTLLVVVHDLIEIYAGDTPLYDDASRGSQQERELAAAERLFALLPTDQATWLRRSWDEFEAQRTPEARFAKALDRLQPLLLNWLAKGGTWHTPGVTADTVRTRTAGIGAASAPLGELAETLITAAEEAGWVRRGKP